MCDLSLRKNFLRFSPSASSNRISSPMPARKHSSRYPCLTKEPQKTTRRPHTALLFLQGSTRSRHITLLVRTVVPLWHSTVKWEVCLSRDILVAKARARSSNHYSSYAMVGRDHITTVARQASEATFLCPNSIIKMAISQLGGNNLSSKGSLEAKTRILSVNLIWLCSRRRESGTDR